MPLFHSFDGQMVTVYLRNNQEARYDHHDI